ncbi:hypothetical protein TTHERM_00627040 (macronuclear) [Tetrahymena thermophila SB210]|uniref:Uncharacterized protein n=1 Tax=Tetrahymena thermophila (strain SB210) TaxID=312017 RepID=Q23RZ5_TETTS|nr:hypothetical protein TTHERM_00627040 [Tetrahymena thermophila SB210]EAR99244.2 hypothetical protein TTHERM_00627040 [Tetrahymena thermophila SB210]|eukprot:XP_001019489.2 hypothetical protein TTHERM_00627040 [Tetrahymena thermophila SB210]
MIEEDSTSKNLYLSEEIKQAIIISIKYLTLTYNGIVNNFNNLAKKDTVSKIYYQYLTKSNVQNNHQFKGRDSIMYDEAQEQSIIFSDEGLLQVNDLEIWYSESEKLFEKGKQIIIQRFIDDNSVDSQAYIKCLETILLPKVNSVYNRKKWMLLQDGVSSYTSKLTQMWCKEKKIEIQQNSPWSPNTNQSNQSGKG